MVSPVVLARTRSIATASGGPKPLTRREIRSNIDWLMTSRPELSDRQLAAIVGVANSTVSRRRQAVAMPEDADSGESAGDSYRVAIAAQETARRLFRAMDKVWEARGLGIGDALFGDRTGDRLANVLEAAYGDDAMNRAKRYRVWIDRAIRELKDR
jgi:hypothetical protein